MYGNMLVCVKEFRVLNGMFLVYFICFYSDGYNRW